MDCDFERENVDLKFVFVISLFVFVIVIVIVFGFVFVFGSEIFFLVGPRIMNWAQSFNGARLRRVRGPGKKPA